MSYSQADLDNIEAAIATGTRDVQIQGRRITYRSLLDMMTIRRVIKDELGQSTQPRVTLSQ